jgi:hypothetical protein
VTFPKNGSIGAAHHRNPVLVAGEKLFIIVDIDHVEAGACYTGHARND